MLGFQFVDKHGYLRTTNGRPYIYTRKIAVCRGRRTPRVLPLGVLDVPLIYGFFYGLKPSAYLAFYYFFFHLLRRKAVRLVRKRVSVIGNQVYGMGRSTVLIP